MTDTTWNPAGAAMTVDRTTPRAAAAVAGFWTRHVTAPLHRALDAGLRAGELRELGAGTLEDIGYRRG